MPEMDQLKKDIRSVLTANQKGLTAEQFSTDYNNLVGYQLNPSIYGFNDLQSLLESMPDVCFSDGYVYRPVITEEVAHIRSLVNRQKRASKKSRASNSDLNRRAHIYRPRGRGPGAPQVNIAIPPGFDQRSSRRQANRVPRSARPRFPHFSSRGATVVKYDRYERMDEPASRQEWNNGNDHCDVKIHEESQLWSKIAPTENVSRISGRLSVPLFRYSDDCDSAFGAKQPGSVNGQSMHYNDVGSINDGSRMDAGYSSNQHNDQRGEDIGSTVCDELIRPHPRSLNERDQFNQWSTLKPFTYYVDLDRPKSLQENVWHNNHHPSRPCINAREQECPPTSSSYNSTESSLMTIVDDMHPKSKKNDGQLDINTKPETEFKQKCQRMHSLSNSSECSQKNNAQVQSTCSNMNWDESKVANVIRLLLQNIQLILSSTQEQLTEQQICDAYFDKFHHRIKFQSLGCKNLIEMVKSKGEEFQLFVGNFAPGREMVFYDPNVCPAVLLPSSPLHRTEPLLRYQSNERPDKPFDGKLSCYYSLSHFYVQNIANYTNAMVVLNKMALEYENLVSQTSKNPLIINGFKVGDPCVAKLSSRYYRGLVKRVNPDYDVFLVDTGELVPKVKNLWPLKEEYLKMPMQAILCCYRLPDHLASISKLKRVANFIRSEMHVGHCLCVPFGIENGKLIVDVAIKINITNMLECLIASLGGPASVSNEQ